MPGDAGASPTNGGKFGSFDDHAIRIELRRIVEKEESRILEELAATENDMRAHFDTSPDVDEDAKRKLFSDMERGKSDIRQGFQMMLDFIQRH